MPAKSKPVRSKTAAERMRARRERLRAAGFRPVQHWVPDLRNPGVRAEIRRQAARLDKHPDTKSLNRWLDAALEDADWK